jgi:hypothetical protein
MKRRKAKPITKIRPKRAEAKKPARGRASPANRPRTPGERNSGCEVCIGELKSFKHPHLTNVFLHEVRDGDLKRVVIESPTQIEPDGQLTYQNDFVYRCAVCGTTWLQQYWEVDTPETFLNEWGHRHARVTPLTDSEVSAIRAALKSGQKLRHDEFA